MWTPKLLDLLWELGARATFFLIAPRAAEQPNADRPDATPGTRGRAALRSSCASLAREGSNGVERTRRGRSSGSTASVSGRSLWRTPWGDLAPWSRRVASEQGLELVGWTVDTHDWRGDAAERMFAATADCCRAGAIVLAHDGIGPGARRNDASETLRFVSLIAAHARRNGLSLDPIAS